MKKSFTVNAAAQMLSVSSKTIYRMIADGQIVAFKCRGCLRVTEESLEAYQRQQILIFQEENGIIGENSGSRADRDSQISLTARGRG